MKLRGVLREFSGTGCLYAYIVVGYLDMQVNWVGAVANEMLFLVTGRCLWKLMLLIRDTSPWRVVRGRIDREERLLHA